MESTVLSPSRKGARPTYSDTPMGNLIRATGLSDAEFASLAGAEKRTVSAWRRGEKGTTLDRFEQLKQAIRARFGENVFLPK